jgi:nucleoside-diphosphate-sugar epimerase
MLVTGATGKIGSRFVSRLLDAGCDVRVLVRDEERGASLRERGAQVVVGDLLRPDSLARAVAGAAVVVHLAAFFRGATEAEAAAVNADGTLALARAALAAGVPRFVFVSTNLVYGPGRGRPAREDDTPQPQHGYPRSKAAAEQALTELYRTQGLGLRILGLAFVYGAGDPHLAEISSWLHAWPAAKRLHMVHHADVAQALTLAAIAPGIDGRTYNVADDEPVAVGDLLRLNGEAVAEEAASRPLDDPWEGIVDTARIRQELGFRPVYPSLYAAQAAGAL